MRNVINCWDVMLECLGLHVDRERLASDDAISHKEIAVEASATRVLGKKYIRERVNLQCIVKNSVRIV